MEIVLPTYRVVINDECETPEHTWEVLEYAEPAGEWRWGVYWRFAIKHRETGDLYGCEIQINHGGQELGLGDGLWEWDDTPDWEPYEAVQTTTYQPKSG